MKSIKQRVAAFLLAVMVTVSGMPIEAFAAETTNSPPEEVESVLRLDNDKNKPLETEDTITKEQTEPEDTPSTTQHKPAVKEDAPEKTEDLDISEGKTSEDMNKQEASSDNTTEGDPEGTVTSKDGKTRITKFEVSWSGISSDTIERSAEAGIYYDTIRYKENPLSEMKLQVNWAISGERFYDPGMIDLKVPSKILFDNTDGTKGDAGYEISDYPVPKGELKEDGSIDFDANYGSASFAYYDEKDTNTTHIINIKKLAPGNSGTYTISYGKLHDHSGYKDMLVGNIRKISDNSIFEMEPSIEVVLGEEKLEKFDKKLYVKQDLSSDMQIKKFGEFYEKWQDEWGVESKPDNDKDYWYAAYEIQGGVNSSLQKSKIVIEDYIGDDQEIVAVAPLKKMKIPAYIWARKNKSYDWYYAQNEGSGGQPSGHKLLSNPEEFKPIKDVTKKDYEITLDDDNYRNYKTNVDIFGMYVIAKIDYKKLGLGKKGDVAEYHKFDNKVKATMYPLNSNDEPKKDEAVASVYYRYSPPKPTVDFTAPPGDELSLKKRTYLGPILYKDGEYNSGHDSSYKISEKGRSGSAYVEEGIPGDVSTGNQPSSLYKNIFGEDLEVRWRVDGSARMAHQTYDPSIGDKDNKDAYGKKKYKLSLTDEYLYLANDYTKELTSEDYELKNLTLNVDSYKYDQYDQYSKYEYRKSNKEEIIGSLYLKKDSDSKWEKVANVKFGPDSYYDNRLIDVEPIHDGITSIKYKSGRMINLPKGYSHVKLDVETNLAGLDMSIRPTGVLKMSSPRVKKYIEDSKTDEYEMDIMLRNDGTLAAYSDEGNLIGIHGTSKRDGKIDRTLDIDLQNYGSELYHDSSYIVFRNKPAPKIAYSERLKKSVDKGRNNTKLQRFEVPTEIIYSQYASNTIYHGNSDKHIRYQKSGRFYDLLPLGVTGIENLRLEDDNSDFTRTKGTVFNNESRYFRRNVYKKIDSENRRETVLKGNVSYKIIENWRNTGRNMLVVDFDGLELEKTPYDNYPGLTCFAVMFDMIYPWDSYKDFGSELKNIVAYESKSDINALYSGLADKPSEDVLKRYEDYNMDILTDLNNEHDEKRFYYSADKTSVTGNTIANTGLTKFIKDSKDPSYSLKTKTQEGGSYSYNIRLQAIKGTTVNDLIFYDSLENYKLLKTDADYGTKRWRGVLEGIDVNHAISRGANPKVYISKKDNLQIQDNQNLNDNSVWTLYKKGDDLSEVKAIAIDLKEKPDGTPFKLKEDESVSVTLYMKAPWDMKKHRIDPEAKAINEIYANTTVTTTMDDISKHKLINTAYTAINLEPVETETTIKAKKSYLDKEDKAIELKGDDFEFNLKDSEGKILQTKTNDKDGNVTFDPIKYHSWDVGEHTYTIEEVKGKDNKIAYDKHIETVKVKVERPEMSEIKASVEYDKDGSNFTNKEKKSASLQLIKLNANEEKFNLEEIKDKDGNLTSYKVPDADLGKTLDGAEYKLYKVNEGKEELVATLTTKNGISNVVEELEAGSYKLVETKAPSGYHLAKDALEFKITDEDAGKLLAKFVTDKGIEDLPSTGGIGTKIFIGTGVTLLGLMAGAMYLANKKKKQATSK